MEPAAGKLGERRSGLSDGSDWVDPSAGRTTTSSTFPTGSQVDTSGTASMQSRQIYGLGFGSMPGPTPPRPTDDLMKPTTPLATPPAAATGAPQTGSGLQIGTTNTQSSLGGQVQSANNLTPPPTGQSPSPLFSGQSAPMPSFGAAGTAQPH